MKKNAGQQIKINNLKWSYHKSQILKGIDFEFRKNCFYGIIGPNGSGKTTLLKNITKILLPQKGTIFINNEDIIDMKNIKVAKIISVVPQSTNLEFEFSVMDVVLMGRNPHIRRFNSESATDIEIAKKAMDLTNTWHLREKSITKISGGERQRVIIARAIAQQAKIMLLDEPVSQLDIHHQVEILNIIKDLNRREMITVITVLHDLNLASQYCDYLLLMDEGKVIKHGLPEQIITPENILKAYGIKVYITKNPITKSPLVIPFGYKDRL